MDCFEYVGIPYEELDCWGLVRKAMRELYDIELPVATTVDAQRPSFEEIDAPRAGDIILMSRLGVLHIGLMTGPDKMLHTSRGKNAVIEHVSPHRFRVTGYFRHQGDGQAAPALDGSGRD